MKSIHTDKKQLKRERRHARIRKTVIGTSVRPRLSVFRSNKFLYAQLIDDTAGRTLAAASTKGLSGKTTLEKAMALGKAIAELSQKQKITKAVFDRGGYIYTGRIKAVAEGAREAGLTL